jgi:hypothetical protein
MGDTPTLARLLRGTPDPTQPSWGGRYVRAWDRPYVRYDRLTTPVDRMEHFGILELALPIGPAAPTHVEGRMIIENQELVGHLDGDRLHFRFSAKDPKTYDYEIRSNAPALDGRTGAITSVAPAPDRASLPSARLPHWWTDDPSPSATDGVHHGARTVSQWREDFLRDFALRMDRVN